MRNMALCIPLNLHFGKKTCWFTACHIFSQKPNRRCNYAVGIKVISMSSQKHWGILRKRNLIADVFFPLMCFLQAASVTIWIPQEIDLVGLGFHILYPHPLKTTKRPPQHQKHSIWTIYFGSQNVRTQHSCWDPGAQFFFTKLKPWNSPAASRYQKIVQTHPQN